MRCQALSWRASLTVVLAATLSPHWSGALGPPASAKQSSVALAISSHAERDLAAKKPERSKKTRKPNRKKEVGRKNDKPKTKRKKASTKNHKPKTRRKKAKRKKDHKPRPRHLQSRAVPARFKAVTPTKVEEKCSMKQPTMDTLFAADIYCGGQESCTKALQGCHDMNVSTTTPFFLGGFQVLAESTQECSCKLRKCLKAWVNISGLDRVVSSQGCGHEREQALEDCTLRLGGYSSKGGDSLLSVLSLRRSSTNTRGYVTFQWDHQASVDIYNETQYNDYFGSLDLFKRQMREYFSSSEAKVSLVLDGVLWSTPWLCAYPKVAKVIFQKVLEVLQELGGAGRVDRMDISLLKQSLAKIKH